MDTRHEEDEAQLKRQVAMIAEGIRARLHGTLMNGTATKGIWVRVTFCFQKFDGAWQIVHDQASVPFDVLTGRGMADLEP